jgi:hypothetical protein
MAIEQIVALLIQEREKISRAIEALQGSAKRIGRSPRNPFSVTLEVNPNTVKAARGLSKQLGTVHAPKKKRHVSAASRRKMALAQKKRWAENKGVG